MTATISGMKSKLGIDLSNSDLDSDLTNALNIATDLTSNDLSKLPSTVTQSNKDHLIELYACYIYTSISRIEEDQSNKYLKLYSLMYKKLYGIMNI